MKTSTETARETAKEMNVKGSAQSVAWHTFVWVVEQYGKFLLDNGIDLNNREEVMSLLENGGLEKIMEMAGKMYKEIGIHMVEQN